MLHTFLNINQTDGETKGIKVKSLKMGRRISHYWLNYNQYISIPDYILHNLLPSIEKHYVSRNVPTVVFKISSSGFKFLITFFCHFRNQTNNRKKTEV